MKWGELGTVYDDGDIIFSEGQKGEAIYVVQHGTVEEYAERGGKKIKIAERAEGEFFGEMAMFANQARSTSMVAKGSARVLTLDKRNLLRRVQEDPFLAFDIASSLAHRVQDLNEELARLKSTSGVD